MGWTELTQQTSKEVGSIPKVRGKSTPVFYGQDPGLIYLCIKIELFYYLYCRQFSN